MKPIIFILLLISGLTADAQKIRFTDPENQWMSLAFNSDNPPFQNTFSYHPDTVVNGIYYRQLHRTSSYYSCSGSAGICPGWSGGGSYACLIREDTLAGIVYYRNNTPDTFEHILYNYNLHVGDLLSMHGFTDSVVSIDSTIINGVFHKIFNMQDTAYGFWRSYTVLEGVGCTNGPIFPFLFGSCFEYGESLFCFSQNGVRPNIHAPINSCATFGTICCSVGGSVFDNTFGCSAALSANAVKAEMSDVVISPIPADNNIEIRIRGLHDNNSIISVYDINGKCLIRKPIIQNTNAINTSLFPNGLYMIIIQGDFGIVRKEKIVITH